MYKIELIYFIVPKIIVQIHWYWCIELCLFFLICI